MEIKQIVFTKKDTAELLTKTGTCGDNEVCVKTAFSTVSCGTERANITGDPNVSIGAPGEAFFPRYLGYSSSGVVTEIGKNVTSVKVGDRVAMFSSTHSSYNILPEYYVVKIEDDRVSLAEAAMSYIAIFPLAAIRKTRLEIGESCLVMGLGILGQLAVQEARAAGAVPIIACDLVAERREEALKNGADYALNPAEEGFAEKVKELTGGGVNVCIEVTGVGQGFDQALDCMARSRSPETAERWTACWTVWPASAEWRCWAVPVIRTSPLTITEKFTVPALLLWAHTRWQDRFMNPVPAGLQRWMISKPCFAWQVPTD